MKAAYCTNGFAPEEMEDAIIRLAQLGYDGLEFWDQYLVGADIPALADRLLAAGISCAQICPYFDFTGTRESWEESIAIARKYHGLALQLGKPLIRVFTGKAGSAEATEEQWAAAVRGLQLTCHEGAEHGLTYALETHRGSLMDTTPSTLRLLEEVGRPNLKVNLQVPLLDEDIMDSASALAPHVVHLHAHNWERTAEGEVLTFLDSGYMDFEGFVRTLRTQGGFDGFISIEHATHSGRHGPFETAEHEIRYLKRLIQSLRPSALG